MQQEPASSLEVTADRAGIAALDTAGAWVLQKLVLRWRAEGATVTVSGVPPEFAGLLGVVSQQITDLAAQPAPAAGSPTSTLAHIGRSAMNSAEEAVALLGSQGFCTKGGADSVGRQTTRSVVQAIQ